MIMNVEKVYKDGKVAVLCGNQSPFTSNACINNDEGFYESELSDDLKEKLLFDPYIVNAVLDGKCRHLIIDYCNKEYNVDFGHGITEEEHGVKVDPLYFINFLTVEWVPEGVPFTMHVDRDGDESVILQTDMKWIVAHPHGHYIKD